MNVHPILLYGCEVWGYGGLHCDIVEIHTDFLKQIQNFKVKKCTPHCLLYGNLVRFPFIE